MCKTISGSSFSNVRIYWFAVVVHSYKQVWICVLYASVYGHKFLGALCLFTLFINIWFCCVFQIKDYGLVDDEKKEETQADDEESIIGADETI